MPFPTTFEQGPVCNGTRIQFADSGNNIVRVLPGSSYRVTNNGTPQVKIRQTNGSGTVLQTINGGASGDVEVPAGITTLFIENVPEADFVDVVFVPVLKEYDGPMRRSPLGFVVKATDSAPRLLTGSFYALDGRRLGNGGVVAYAFEPTDTAESIGY